MLKKLCLYLPVVFSATVVMLVDETTSDETQCNKLRPKIIAAEGDLMFHGSGFDDFLFSEKIFINGYTVDKI